MYWDGTEPAATIYTWGWYNLSRHGHDGMTPTNGTGSDCGGITWEQRNNPFTIHIYPSGVKKLTAP